MNLILIHFPNRHFVFKTNATISPRWPGTKFFSRKGLLEKRVEGGWSRVTPSKSFVNWPDRCLRVTRFPRVYKK